MDYFDYQQERKEREAMGYFSRLAAAQQDMRETCLDNQKAFDDLDDFGEMLAYMRPYIREMLQVADEAFDGSRRAQDRILSSLYQLQRIYNNAADDAAEKGFDYE